MSEPPAKRAKLEDGFAMCQDDAAPGESRHGKKSLWQRIEEMDFQVAPQEHEVGITEYVDPSIPAIHGILKHRYIDFIVHEVDSNGNVLRLTKIDKPDAQPLKPIEDEALQIEAASGEFNSEESHFLIKNLGETKWTSLLEYYKTGRPSKKQKESAAALKPVCSEPITEKADRTAFHKAVRAVFGEELATETLDKVDGDKQHQVIQIVWADGRTKSRSAAATRIDHPPYIHFTLHKCNKETHDCLTRISKLLHVNVRELGIAGTKDKRGITTQRVSLRATRLKPQRNSHNNPILDVFQMLTGPQARPSNKYKHANNKQGDLQGIRVGDFEFAQNAIELGQLSGNQFTVTLRDVSPDVLESADHVVHVVREKGFINYYGMQRFGTSAVPTHAVGLACLKSDWQTAVKLILSPKPGEQPEAIEARRLWNEEQKAAKALKSMPRYAVAERCILEVFASNQSSNEAPNYYNALSKIPKNLKMMYVHGYQSYIWNTVLSERIRLNGCQAPVVGDIVYADEGSVADAATSVEQEDSVLEDATQTPNTAENIQQRDALSQVEQLRQLSKVPSVKTLTQEDINSGRYTIFDVVLQLPGFVVGYPPGQLGVLYRSLMEADGLDPNNLHRKQPEFSMAGTYRKIMHKPTLMQHRVFRYDNLNEPLALSDEDVALGRSLTAVNPAGRHAALQFDIQLGTSSYATMALRELIKAPTNPEAQKTLTNAMEAKSL